MSWTRKEWRDNGEGSVLAGAIGALLGAATGMWLALKGLGWMIAFLPAAASISKALMVLLLVGIAGFAAIIAAFLLGGLCFIIAFAAVEALRG